MLQPMKKSPGNNLDLISLAPHFGKPAKVVSLERLNKPVTVRAVHAQFPKKRFQGNEPASLTLK